ncbi:hypothetical protein KCU71_g13292, partial [Aureobasidium melanogenum]
MYPSEELGSPSLALSIEVPRSPSLPRGGTPPWDNMSLPSSPSLRARVPESTMNLNRYAKRGFSEDLALPPRQIEKPFRFLDLPAEIRNMIYELTITRRRVMPCNDWDCHCKWDCHRYSDYGCHLFMQAMKHQCRLSPLASVSRCLRAEFMSLYYATTDFAWYWDPLKTGCEISELPLADSISFLQHLLDFATINGVHIKSITLCSPHDYYRWGYDLEDIADSLRFLAPLRKALAQNGRVHPMLREFKFENEASFPRRLFDFSGSLGSLALKNKKSMDQELRLFLHGDPDAKDMIRYIESWEEEERYYARESRWRKKMQTRNENKVKGDERWGGVLRSRPAEV